MNKCDNTKKLKNQGSIDRNGEIIGTSMRWASSVIYIEECKKSKEILPSNGEIESSLRFNFQRERERERKRRREGFKAPQLHYRRLSDSTAERERERERESSRRVQREKWWREDGTCEGTFQAHFKRKHLVRASLETGFFRFLPGSGFWYC